MALFGKKKSANEDSGENPAAGAEAWAPDPDKASKWFQHARTNAESSNYAYALHCYACGIKLDPESMTQHEAMYAAATRYREQGGKPAAGKEIKEIEDGTAMSKFAAAEFAWMKDLANFKLAAKALDAAVKADQLEFGKWMSRGVVALVNRQKKSPSKNQLVALMELLQAVEAFDESLQIGEMARNIDPSDNDLASKLKNLAAERAMSQGGYEQAAGQEGGFRSFVKDADKQRELIEEESLAAGASAEERNLHRAKTAYEESPTTPDNINRYAQLLKKQATSESVEQAYQLYMKGFEDTGEYRFRMAAGDIRIEQGTLKLKELREDDARENLVNEAQRELLELKVAEYEERVGKYPTDRFRKFDLGTVQYELANYDGAMAGFQNAKDEPKLHARAAHMLGRCFAAEGWHSEAVAEYREALSVLEVTDKDRELEISYDLMLALMAAAADETSGDYAREAKEICSGIARKNITYRDIRQKRREIDELIKEVG